MKKLLLGFMAVGAALSLTACGNKSSQSSNSSSTQSSQIATKKSSSSATTLDADH